MMDHDEIEKRRNKLANLSPIEEAISNVDVMIGVLRGVSDLLKQYNQFSRYDPKSELNLLRVSFGKTTDTQLTPGQELYCTNKPLCIQTGPAKLPDDTFDREMVEGFIEKAKEHVWREMTNLLLNIADVYSPALDQALRQVAREAFLLKGELLIVRHNNLFNL